MSEITDDLAAHMLMREPKCVARLMAHNPVKIRSPVCPSKMSRDSSLAHQVNKKNICAEIGPVTVARGPSDAACGFKEVSTNRTFTFVTEFQAFMWFGALLGSASASAVFQATYDITISPHCHKHCSGGDCAKTIMPRQQIQLYKFWGRHGCDADHRAVPCAAIIRGV